MLFDRPLVYKMCTLNLENRSQGVQMINLTDDTIRFPPSIMNERIRELAREAGFYANPDVEKFEKFAELIVRECVNEIHVADVGDLKGKSYYLDKVAEHIEKHFGVEE